jgi:hypothetical protein
LVILPLSLFRVENLICLSHGVQVAGRDEDHGRNRRPSAEDQGRSDTGWVLGGRMIERSGDAVCGLHRAREDEERGFLG